MPPLVVTVDGGGSTSVADALLGADPRIARTAVVEWAEAVAALHVATRDLRPAFRAALAAGEGDLPVADAPMAVGLEDAVRVLDRECGALGVRVPGEAFDELRGLVTSLGTSGAAALSPSDTCPDNNVRTPDGLLLLDFEGAEWRHVAWDVAYLRVPWPTCWCSWRLPDEVAERAVRRYQEASELAWARMPEFRADIQAAATAWAFMTSAMFMERALGDDPPPADPAKVMPPRRALILDRLGAAAGDEPTALAAFAASLRGALVERWGEVALPYAPAFRR
jgi:hypothetical protein